MKLLGIIPARYASSRLPGKPLVDIGGKSMVQRVWEQASASRSLARVVIATDDDRIAGHVRTFGGEALMTRRDHPSGTDRCHEALMFSGATFDGVVNIQGDEPFVVPAQIDEAAEALNEDGVDIATLAQVITDDRDLDDPGEAKIIVDHRMNALLFSRSPVPYLRNSDGRAHCQQFRYLKHVGLYAYRSDALARIVQLPPSPLELAESLEQLRWLEAGMRIRVGLTEHPSFCVDTPADLEEARRRCLA
ncbi:MAG: 3-deoxy-manno-octulosonate cytidylyltransferase [Flavobacteriales bacterium]|nr:3-deoxy-manno-octulosonate cytidylyltransferase [Flavobacteriales bacterium]MBK7555006.1 3-deoxy-manno-octulosonate cytidylyltransferase [Flavobacteriales bacterium]MBK9194789.1 3-deoxy-manno-octulosonate cytidylyltransferase [Flavobacteriales bacterium]